MSLSDELLSQNNSTVNAALVSGLKVLSRDYQLTFTQYVRLVLPLDGFVFWVRGDLVGQSARFNASALDGSAFNAPFPSQPAASTQTLSEGSLHYSADQRQNEDETLAVNSVVLTTSTEVQPLNEVAPGTIWVGSLPDGTRFTFSRRGRFYNTAGLYHYMGEALYPALASQLVDDPTTFDASSLVVSNSLPAWLALNGYAPLYLDGFNNLGLPLFPSFAVPDNLTPPYASVHIEPSDTSPLQMTPYIDATMGHWQLARDRVRVTLYGVRNAAALNFLDCVQQYSLDTDAFGLMSVPIVKDEKRTQVELSMLAMKKTIDFEVSYYQNRVNGIARQYITRCVPTFTTTS